jgi:carbonic anhydrase/acetyltransferase-like protein (isoleucine patch superfamily)
MIHPFGEHTPDIHDEAFVHPDATVIGEVFIGARASIWPSTVLRGDMGRIVVGEESSIQDARAVSTSPSAPRSFLPASVRIRSR